MVFILRFLSFFFLSCIYNYDSSNSTSFIVIHNSLYHFFYITYLGSVESSMVIPVSLSYVTVANVLPIA